MRRSPTVLSGKQLLTATSLALLTAIPVTANALALTRESNKLNGSSVQQSTTQQWLLADRDDKKDGITIVVTAMVEMKTIGKFGLT